MEPRALGLGELRRTVLNFEQRILAFVDLPLRDIADEMTGALDRMAAAVDDVDIAGLFSPVTEFGDSVGSAISGLAAARSATPSKGVWGSVEAALGQAAAALEQLRAALAAVTDQLGEFASRVGPGREELVTAATADCRARRRLRPDPAGRRGARQPAPRARPVAAIDVSRSPPTPCSWSTTPPTHWPSLDIAAPSTGPHRRGARRRRSGTSASRRRLRYSPTSATQLRAVDPTALIATLESPVSAVLDGLAELDPARLSAVIDEAVAPFGRRSPSWTPTACSRPPRVSSPT